jgi:hypothetical protein
MATGILDRLDDAINPIVVKELRQAVKSRLVVFSLLFFLLLQVVVLGLILWLQEIQTSDPDELQAGQGIFLTLQGILLGVCLLLVPSYTGVRLAAERSDTNVDLLFISALKPWSIVWGKFLSAAVLVLLIFSACAPFMTFTYLLRGIDIPTILLIIGMDFLAVMAATMLAVFLAAVPSNRGLKGVLFLLGFLVLIGLFSLALSVSAPLVFQRGMVRLDTEEFWAGIAGVVGLILAEMGQYFVWSVALISPPSANRALLVRSYTAARCLLTLIAAVWIAYVVRHPAPIYMWQGTALFLFAVQLTISISERDHLGPRVARTIPRNGLLRGLAFLFYSGAAGGILFCVLLGGLALGLGPVLVILLGGRFTGPGSAPEDARHVAFVMLLLALYAYAYGLLAVVCRRVFLRHHLRPVLTWLVGLILVALGCALPYLFLLVFAQNAAQFEHQHPWVLLTNPFASVMTAGDALRERVPWSFADSCVVFVSSWAMLMTLVCLPWVFQQIQAFRPLARRAVRAVAAEKPPELPLAVPVEPSGNGQAGAAVAGSSEAVSTARPDGQP